MIIEEYAKKGDMYNMLKYLNQKIEKGFSHNAANLLVVVEALIKKGSILYISIFHVITSKVIDDAIKHYNFIVQKRWELNATVAKLMQEVITKYPYFGNRII
jgi:hypothetical protein